MRRTKCFQVSDHTKTTLSKNIIFSANRENNYVTIEAKNFFETK